MMLSKFEQKRKPTIVGTGLVALDVVFQENCSDPIGRWAGGTCGNVLNILSWMSWNSYPVARLRGGSEAKAIKKDFRRFDVKTNLITQSEKGSTPVILQYIKQDKKGNSVHRFKMRCPVCGNRLPSFRPITSNCVSSLEKKLPTSDVFFFDRTSRGILDLAAQYFDDGALVVFEPSGKGEPRHFEEAIEIAHIVKFSNDRLQPNDVPAPESYPYVHIETRGNKGLRYRCQLEEYASNGWVPLPANEIIPVRDTAGAGDWCTAGIIQRLGASGSDGLWTLSQGALDSAIQLGQAMSAWSCMFEGARGGMYQSTFDDFRIAVDNIMDGQKGNEVNPAGPIQKKSKTPPYLCVDCDS